jgi:hypothetical protein
MDEKIAHTHTHTHEGQSSYSLSVHSVRRICMALLDEGCRKSTSSTLAGVGERRTPFFIPLVFVEHGSRCV